MSKISLKDKIAIDANRTTAEERGKVILFREGKFFRAFNRSAWLISQYIYNEEYRKKIGAMSPLSVTRNKSQGDTDYYILCGFPIHSIEKYSGGLPYEALNDEQAVITMPEFALGMTEEEYELAQLEQAAKKRDSIIIDAFLFCCYTGLRYSDMLTLRSDHIVRQGSTVWLIKRTIKTGSEVRLPLTQLFGGKALTLISKHGSIDPLTRLPCNSTTNKLLRHYLTAHTTIRKRVTFHTSRHTCATCLVHYGVPITTVQHLLGHQKLSTTQHYSEILPHTILQDLKRCKFPK